MDDDRTKNLGREIAAAMSHAGGFGPRPAVEPMPGFERAVAATAIALADGAPAALSVGAGAPSKAQRYLVDGSYEWGVLQTAAVETVDARDHGVRHASTTRGAMRLMAGRALLRGRDRDANLPEAVSAIIDGAARMIDQDAAAAPTRERRTAAALGDNLDYGTPLFPRITDEHHARVEAVVYGGKKIETPSELAIAAHSADNAARGYYRVDREIAVEAYAREIAGEAARGADGQTALHAAGRIAADIALIKEAEAKTSDVQYGWSETIPGFDAAIFAKTPRHELPSEHQRTAYRMMEEHERVSPVQTMRLAITAHGIDTVNRAAAIEAREHETDRADAGVDRAEPARAGILATMAQAFSRTR